MPRANLFDPITGILDKLCKDCGCQITRENCYYSGSYRSVSGRCRTCFLKQSRKWKNNNPEKAAELERNRHLTKTYGITTKEYDRLFNEQKGVCAICGKIDSTNRSLGVDHCHKTNKV